ncbi:hypothetical protein QF032_000102 [Streptomyces achromogenes]|uniref:Uncharacterized protein n=1 Tax=Streptomyces achromogenes TaxID=67255 RepID=A0ABU0PT44_STRAH|nr:hypothetical protein [Streptomyces achromogenes]MDQ0828258.1 hypothetical protein [Streptomyces achromogenes]
MAGHEVYAASALSVVAAILLARWCLAGRSGRQRTAAGSRRASRWTALREVRRTGSPAAQAGPRLPTDAAGAQGAVQEAEELVHGYWRQLSPLYLSKRDHPQH